MSKGTAKPGGVTNRELLELLPRLRSIFDPASLRVVTTGAYDRTRAEKLIAKVFKRPKGMLRNTPRLELMTTLAAAFFERDDIAKEMVRDLDRATHAECSLVSSLDVSTIREQMGSFEALRLRRHGAKLFWALARDEREIISSMARDVVREYVERADKLDRARKVVREKGAEAELNEFENLFQSAAKRAHFLEAEVSAVEKERATLLVEVGRQKAELRKEMERRRELAAQLAEVQKSSTPHVSPPPEQNTAELERHRHKLQKRLAAVERERDGLRKICDRVPDLEADNERLRRTIEMLRKHREKDNGRHNADPIETTVSGAPLVESPRRHQVLKGNKRVGVFVDVANLAGAARRVYGGAVDYRRLLHLVVAGKNLSGAFAFAIDKGTSGYDAFAVALREAGYKVFTKRPKTFADGSVKADWDVGITVEMLSMQSKLDVVVLGSGDGDFVPAVHHLRQKGLRVEVAAFTERSAKELLAAADGFIELDESVLEDPSKN